MLEAQVVGNGAYSICHLLRYAPFRTIWSGVRARALCVSPDVLDSPGGTKSFRHSPPVQAAGFPPASAEVSRPTMRTWQRDILPLQRPLTRSSRFLREARHFVSKVVEPARAVKNEERGVVTRRHTLEAMYCVTILVIHSVTPSVHQRGVTLPHRPVCRPAMVTIMVSVGGECSLRRSHALWALSSMWCTRSMRLGVANMRSVKSSS